MKAGFIKKKDLNQVIVDTTVQEKNIRFPTDARLYERMRERLIKEVEKSGIKLRQTYKRVGKKELHRLSGYRKAQQFKRARKSEKKIKVYLGRVYRDIQGKVKDPSEELKGLLLLADRLLKQSKKDKNKLYSIHEPEVECIAKGKAHKKYEFGNKVSIATSLRSNWLLGALSFQGNPYDGKTLSQTIEQVEKLTDTAVNCISLDMGYRKHNYEGDAEVFISNRYRKKVKASIKKIWKRRSAVEPVIGHMKSDHALSRNKLKGTKGDNMNVILSACGFNMRKLLKAFSLFQIFFVKLLKKLEQEMKILFFPVFNQSKIISF